MRLLAHRVMVTPPADIKWNTDIHGNAVGVAVFDHEAACLQIDSFSEVQMLGGDRRGPETVTWTNTGFPAYSEDEVCDLGALMANQYKDQDGRVSTWAKEATCGTTTDPRAVVGALSRAVSNVIRYKARDQEGTRPPQLTLALGEGACRDFAVLLIEGARSLGFGARLVSGYLYNPGGDLKGAGSAGATHAWAEIYLSGHGWVAFDPTNPDADGGTLIPVAVARDMKALVPVSGSFFGMTDAFQDMSIAIQVTDVPLDAAMARYSAEALAERGLHE